MSKRDFKSCVFLITLLIAQAFPHPIEAQEAPVSPASVAVGQIVYPAKNADHYDAGQQWKLVWADEFEGDKLNQKNWTRQVLPDPFNEEWQQYFDRQENSYVENGHLILKAIHHGTAHGDNQYTSARLHTGGKQEFKYGKIAARIQLPFGQGIWPAFWMLGADSNEIGGETPWPRCGEIDIIELWGSRDNGVVEANLHYDDAGHKSTGPKPFKLSEGIFAEKFHVFEFAWNENHAEWFVDGQSYSKVDISSPAMQAFHKKFYILLNIAVGGKWAGDPDNTTPFPSFMYVDWVRAYEQK